MGLLSDYFDLFDKTLKDFLIPRDVNPNNPPIDETIITKFEQLKALRDEYIETMIAYVKYSVIDPEWLFKILESAYNAVNSKINDFYYDYNNHLQLFLNEMFLYLITILLKHEKYEIVAFLLKNNYGVEQDYPGIEFKPFNNLFNNYNRYLDEHRNGRLKLNRVSVSADLIKERATNHIITFEDIIETDLLLHYCGLLMHKTFWFPRLSIYNSRSGRPKIIQRMKSKRFFEKVKPIFNINSKTDLFEKLQELDKNIYNNIHGFSYRFVGIFEVFKTEEICTID